MAESIYDFNSNLNIQGVLNIDYSFQEYEKSDANINNIKFDVTVERKSNLKDRTALNTQLSDITSISANIGPPLSYLFNSQVMKLYFELFSYYLR